MVLVDGTAPLLTLFLVLAVWAMFYLAMSTVHRERRYWTRNSDRIAFVYKTFFWFSLRAYAFNGSVRMRGIYRSEKAAMKAADDFINQLK